MPGDPAEIVVSSKKKYNGDVIVSTMKMKESVECENKSEDLPEIELKKLEDARFHHQKSWSN